MNWNADHAVQHVKHVPLHPPRASVAHEGLFLAAWNRFATERPGEWRRIFDTTGPVRQRAASVAASFMVYMGCNGGACFTDRALRLSKSNAFDYAGSAFLAAWSLENRRAHFVNHGLRTIEYMLALEYPVAMRRQGRDDVNWKQVPNVTMEDVDIIESMVVWWASSTAELMREMVEAQFKALEAEQRAAIAAKEQ